MEIKFKAYTRDRTFGFESIKKEMKKASITSLNHAAGRIRQWARRLIKVRPRGVSSIEGTPANTHPQKSKNKIAVVNYPLKNSIAYAVDKDSQTAAIGVSFSGLLDIGYAHEIGGWYRSPRADRPHLYPKRPFMKPALMGVLPDLPKYWEGILKES